MRRKRQKADEQTELILSSIPSILIGVNREGHIAHWNSVAESVFGISARRALHTPFSECGIQWDSERVLAGIRECQKKKSAVRVDDVDFIRPNGQKGVLGFAVIPLREGEGESREYLLFGADITERKRMDQLKHDFISTVSHELRTPLTIIKEGVSQVAEGILGEINKDQKRFLSISLEGIDRLRRIVDDLLDISKIEAGKLELKRESVDIASLAKGVALAFDYQAKERGLEIKIHLPPFPVKVYIDRDKMIQVFTNLISNALKFTDKGKIEIEIGDKGHFIECRVSDTGRGIAQEDLPKVFGKFQQFSRPVSSTEKGTGLGLAICKGIVELHHGEIGSESKLDEGTTFFFKLPKLTAKELFREQIVKSLDEAIRQESSLSIIVFTLKKFEMLRREMGEEKLSFLTHELERIIRQNLHRAVDVVIKDTSALLIVIPGTRKEEALMEAGRIQQAFDSYLAGERLERRAEISCKVAAFPEDANTPEGLLKKVI